MSMKCRRNLVRKPIKEPEHHFENLYGLLCNEVWLRAAAPHNNYKTKEVERQESTV